MIRPYDLCGDKKNMNKAYRNIYNSFCDPDFTENNCYISIWILFPTIMLCWLVLDQAVFLEVSAKLVVVSK